MRPKGKGRAWANAANEAAKLAAYRKDYSAAENLWRENLAIYEHLADAKGAGNTLSNLGVMRQMQGHYGEAEGLFRQAIELLSAVEAPALLANALEGLANVIVRQAEALPEPTQPMEVLAGAIRYYEQGLAIRRELKEVGAVAHSLNNLAHVLMTQGDFVRARPLLKESLSLRSGLGESPDLALGLESWARCEVGSAAQDELHSLVRAACLYGAASALRERIDAAITSDNRAEYDRDIGTLRVRLKGNTFSKAWREGEGMDAKRAVHYALEE